MSWKPGLQRHLPVLRFFACPESPSSAGLRAWYENNYDELKLLNPNLGLLLRWGPNCLPAVTTEIDFTIDDQLKYMMQQNKFRNPDGSIAQDRVEAANAYLQTDWDKYKVERWACPGFDPCAPFLEDKMPDWRRSKPEIAKDLQVFLGMKDTIDDQKKTFMSGPNDEYTKATNSLLMCQRVDLWCAGEDEVEAAVQHLFMLGKRFNSVEKEIPDYVSDFYPGVSDI